MPRFFFNHRTNDGHTEIDLEGMKLPSLNSALDEATFAAEGAIAVAEEPVEGVFEIEDEGRVLVARVPYAASAEEEQSDANGQEVASGTAAGDQQS